MPVCLPVCVFALKIKVLDTTLYTVVRSGSEVREIITLKFKDNFAAGNTPPESV